MSRSFPLFGAPGRISQREGGSADDRGTRAGYPFHEWLTKNHDFLVQPTGVSGMVGGRGPPARQRSQGVSLADSAPALPVEPGRPREEIRRRCTAQLNTT